METTCKKLYPVNFSASVKFDLLTPASRSSGVTILKSPCICYILVLGLGTRIMNR